MDLLSSEILIPNFSSSYTYIFNTHSQNSSSSLKLKYSGSLIKSRSYSELNRRLASIENPGNDGAVLKRELFKFR
jgi:hypothetical protein